jgi:serine kinase of HPr protein (carbohydrate metabolism regulator)
MSQIHATCVEVDGLGVLLRGESGAGKSDLALRLIDGGARLVADDRTDLAAEDGRLVATCPAPLAGRLEIRGLGIGPVPNVARAPVALVVDLVAAEAVERLPEPEHCLIEGISVRRLAVAPFEPSAPAKVRLAARWVQCGIMPAQ